MPKRLKSFFLTMSNPFFRFKQFCVHHDRCAMKVGTDGVLLGAWANAGNGAMILDVGTGTGLIALMMAQRYPAATIRAIDIDRDAVDQAQENVGDSPFADRMTVVQDDFRHYASVCAEKFDLIVSNPPWFNHAHLPPDAQRKTARHSVSLTLTELLFAAANCLSPEGVLALILPYDQQKELEMQAREHGFFLKRETVVYPLPASNPKRLLTEWTRSQSEDPTHSKLTVELARHRYSEEFIELVREFYLYL